MAKLPRGTDLYDRGAKKERERILKIIRAHRDSHDQVLAAAEWRALDEVIRSIEAE